MSALLFDILLILQAPERCDPPLVAPIVENATVAESPTLSQAAAAPLSSDTATPLSSSQLFRPLDDESSGSDSDAGVNLNKMNEKWAQYMLKLDSLRYPGVNEKKKGKKNQTIKFALETPEIRQLNEALGKIERDYLFDRREAGESLPDLQWVMLMNRVDPSDAASSGSSRCA